ncbi:MAG TPA: hypothetical protein PLF22_03405 [Pseudomonadales bacterium]|nr:hypothetical protein [Pseudomonadales bacterium]
MQARNRQRIISPGLWLWPCLALPVLLHFCLLFLYAVNAPRLDDFSEILTFLPDWHAASGAQEKCSVLFRDYQNHRYVFYHALLVIFDHINFRNATIIGNLPLVMLCGMLLTVTKNHPQKTILWIITPLLVFNLQSWRAMFWGPLGTSNLLYPCIALLTCRLAVIGTRGVFLAAVMTAFLALAHGSGPILLPVIAGYLWTQRQNERYAKPVFWGWIIFSLATLMLYFVIFPLHSDAGYSSHSSRELLENFFLKAGDVASGFFALLGSHMLYNDASQPWKHQLAIALGVIEFFWLARLVMQGALNKYPALLMWLAFLLLTAASIASGRVAYAGIDQAMQGHYKLLNSIMLWFVIVATLEFIARKYPGGITAARMAAIALPLALYLCGWLLFLTPMQAFQRSLIDDVWHWQETGKLENTETRLYVKQPNLKLKTAVDGGFYIPGN